MYHANPCGDCAGGLGQIDADSNGGGSWWEGPLEAITGAVSDRISGSTSPYSPGTYNYGSTAYASYPQPQPVQLAPAPAPGFRLTPTTGIVLAVVALAGLKLTGII